MPAFLTISRLTRLSLLALVAATAACNDKDTLPEDDHDHDDEHIETAGRLVFGQADSPTAHVYDLDHEELLGSFTLDFPASAVRSSPDRRYAVVLQRNDDRTQFIDGGLWQEDHGDHLHDYEADPLLIAFKLDGVRPTHFETHDELSALFFDGNSTAGQNAGVAVLSDASLTDGMTVATLDFPVAMHGTAEPRGDYLLTTHREASAPTSLPSAVDLYLRNGEGYDFVERFEPACPDLHGSFSNETHTAFGCSDGVLLIEQDGESFSATQIANPESMPMGSRIGTLVGHHELAGFGGFAGSALYDIDPDSGSMTEVDWRNGDETLSGVAYAMDAHGEHFMILDDTGRLHFLDPADGWATTGTVDAIDSFVESYSPGIAVSHGGEVAFLTHPADQSIVIVDLEAQSVSGHIELGFVPVGLTWVGLPEHEHEH